MLESWRWFGPNDGVTLPEIAQTGATGIVTALHDIPYGEIWDRPAIARRSDEISCAPGNLHWAVVESLPVHDDIKRGSGDLDRLFANYRQSMANLAAEGVSVICYNFMPLLDWTRTRLDATLPSGGHALRYDAVDMAVFDIHMLARSDARADYPPDVVTRAESRAAETGTEGQSRLLSAIMAGLPGAFARYDVGTLRTALSVWNGITAGDLRANLGRFLAEIVPAAEDLGVRLCIHPDDPPRPLLGLPRVVSTGADIAAILAMQDSPANGLTLCSGSLGAHADNDVPAIARRFAGRIHFAHLRNVANEPDGSFQEAAHLDGDTDMAALVDALLTEEAARRSAGRSDADIPFRPDHGHALLSDLARNSHPGYPLIGRMRGLAELRGIITGLGHARSAGLVDP
ncbi:MAG: mannonate dehydratase [Marinibacterium sp.]